MISDSSRFIRVNFFLELPNDIRMPNNATVSVDTDEMIPGTEHFEVQATIDAPIRRGLREGISFWFRRATLDWSVLEAINQTFWAELGARGTSPPPRLERSCTALQMTRLLLVNGEIADLVTEDFLTEVFDDCLSALNHYLVSLGLGAQDVTIDVVKRTQLPPMIPYIVSDVFSQNPEASEPHRGVMLLHMRLPSVMEPFPEDILNHAGRLWAESKGGRHPFFQCGEFLLSAYRGLYHSRYPHAVVDAQTSVEILVSTTIREAGLLRGTESDRIDTILNAPFRNRIEHHLGRLAGVNVDLDDGTNPFGRWWMNTYRLRNRVVHEGYQPLRAEAETAVASASELTQVVGQCLQGDPITATLSRFLLRTP